MIDADKMTAELNRKLDPGAVRKAPTGKFGQYVDGYHVISEANRIFGNLGWSYSITRLEETHRALVDLKGNNGPYQQFRCSFMCTVRVTVGDTSREGAAVGMGAGKPENTGDVIESAVKEAETDALKRALRTYGNTFGLALYDVARENVGVDLPPFDPVACFGRLVAAVSKRETEADLIEFWKHEADSIADLKAADPVIYNDLRNKIAERRATIINMQG